MRRPARTVLAFSAALVLAACSTPSEAPTASTTSASPTSTTDTPSPTSSTTTSPSTTTTQAAQPEGTIEGRWCPVPGSAPGSGPIDGCVTVELPMATYDDGTSVDITAHGSPWDQGKGVLAYSTADAPFGSFYPAGVPIDLSHDPSLTDRPDEDRIWNSQDGTFLVRDEAPTATEPTATEPAFQLDGRWRSRDGSVELSMDELREDNPAAFVADRTPSTLVPGATDVHVCLAADLGPGECSTAASMFLRYLPAGVEWDCARAGREGRLPFDLTRCDPDFSAEHRTDEARLLRLPNHQHSADYVDSMPMYQIRP